MFISTIPDLPRNLTRVVQIHTHTLLLRTLASEHVRRHRLLDLSLTKQDLLLILTVTLASLNLDDLTTSNHTNVLKLHLQRIVW